MERRLIAILAIDVVGYSLLMGYDEEGTLANLNTRRKLIDEQISQHLGRIFGSAGDSVIAEFASPVKAVRCSIRIQQELNRMNTKQPAVHQMLVRIGLHLGDAIVDKDNLYGECVNVAARLEQLAEPGGILVSDDIARQTEGKVGAKFEHLGERWLKNIGKPVGVHRVMLGDTNQPANVAVKARTLAAHRTVVAVLPFKNLSKDPEQDYFADGISEDIITGLSKNPDILVMSKNTTFASREGPLSPSVAYETLGARFVLEGSVRKSGKRTRVTAQLADMAEKTQLWAERFDCEMDDIFALQDEVVISILHALGAADGVLERTARKLSKDLSPDGGTAYDCYLQGRGHFYRHGNSGFDQAEALYEKAIALDPDFARAYSALAWLHFLSFMQFRTKSFEEIKSKTLELAQTAHRLDSHDVRAHWVLGGLHLHEGNLTHSNAELDKALRLDPNNADLLVWSASVLVYAGQEEVALERCKHALRLNPNCPDWYYWCTAAAYFHLGLYEDALVELEQMSATEYAGRIKAATYAHLGRLEDARSEAHDFLELVPTFSVSDWARTEFYSNPKELERFVEGLRIAGLPQ
ncbi:MAG: tetratricopeptide repeat protein [Rhodobacteraceae bacterium]|nr:tetratricopeptide repeat protein [Paracoccaceae bacterium]